MSTVDTNDTIETKATTEAKINANRENARKSTGAKTEEGKHRSSLNACKHGFSGLTMVLSPEEAKPYRLFKDQHLAEFEPVGVDELHHANSVIEHRFRLWQIAATETAVYALGYREHIYKFSGETPEMASAMCRVLTVAQHKDELDRLHRYEVRLHRQEIKDMAAFRCFQANRRKKETEQFRVAVTLMHQAEKNRRPFDPQALGFVWTHDQIFEFSEAASVRRMCRHSGMEDKIVYSDLPVLK